MGFVNREANLQGKIHNRMVYFQLDEHFFIEYIRFVALIATFGDVNAAVERLLALNQLSLS